MYVCNLKPQGAKVAITVCILNQQKLQSNITELGGYYSNLSMHYLLSSCIQGVVKLLLHIIATSTTTSQDYKGHPAA